MPRIIPFLCLLLVMAGCAIQPQPITEVEIETRALKDLENMLADQQPVGDTPITLYEAMARAVKYNLDHRLKLMEAALEMKQLDAARLDLLPDIAASAGYSFRSNDYGSNSRSLIDGTQSLVPSTSQERTTATADMTVMWNILDFGLSYARAKQHTDRILIVEERRRKVIQNIIQDVRYAYYRAVSSDILVRDMLALLDQTKSALDRSRRISEELLQPPRETLEYQRTLLENVRLLWRLVQELAPARVELATLMNLPPGTRFRLVEPEWIDPVLQDFDAPVEKLEYLALVSRPELREEDYKERINIREKHKALLRMLPGIRLDLGANYDTNDYLVNKQWWDAAGIITQNVLGLFSGPANYRAAQAQEEVDRLRRQALSLAVIMQVHLAHQRFHLLRQEYQVTRRLDDINTDLNSLMATEAEAGSATELSVIQAATSALVARMRHHVAYAEMQNAAGRIYHSIGMDPLPLDTGKADLAIIARAIKDTFLKWEKTINVVLVEKRTGDGADPAEENLAEQVENRPEEKDDLDKVAKLAMTGDEAPKAVPKPDPLEARERQADSKQYIRKPFQEEELHEAGSNTTVSVQLKAVALQENGLLDHDILDGASGDETVRVQLRASSREDAGSPPSSPIRLDYSADDF